MKKSKIVSLIIVIFICLSTVSYAGNLQKNFNSNGYTAITETTKTENMEQSSCALVIRKNNNKLTTSVNGASHSFEIIDGMFIDTKNTNNTIFSIKIKSADGTKEYATLSNSISYLEEEDVYLISLSTGGADISYDDLVFEFEMRDESGTKLEPVIVSPGINNLDVQRNVVEKGEGFLAGLIALVKDGLGAVSGMVESLLTDLVLRFADGILYVVSRAVGEVVTIDRLIFNKVDKVNINYWTVSSTDNTVKGMMAKVVNPWYAVFYKIAIMVYMIVLIIVGIEVLLNSTAEKKAKYKEVIMSWVVGVAMLTLFPYVMKYIVVLNEAVVTTMEEYHSRDANTVASKNVPSIITVDSKTARESFGKSEFITLMTGVTFEDAVNISEINDAMMQTRLAAQETGRFVLTAVYVIMIGQMIILLFMYYKRAFMLAFLVTIYPLIAMTYVVDKLGDKKAQSFGIWFKEYIVNVIVQMFHAVVYILIVGTGFKSYMLTGGQNWLFMIISVLFLFEGEKILRNIFGVKSSANTIGDLASGGLAAFGVYKSIKGLGKGSKSIGSESDNAINSEANDRINQRRAVPAIPTSAPEGAPATSTGQYTGNDPDGVNTSGFDAGAAEDVAMKNALERRLTRGMLSGGINFGAKAASGIIGTTYGMSKGSTGKGGLAQNAIAGGIAGRAVGEIAAKPFEAIANKGEQIHHGNKEARKIEQGDYDEKLGLNLASNGESIIPEDVDPNEIIGRHGESTQEIYRQALAEMTRVAASKGAARGRLAYQQYIERNTKRRGD